MKGGSIGMNLTGVLVQIFMICWNREFAKRLQEVGIVWRMTGKYVEDINIITPATTPGLRYKDGKMIMNITSIEEVRRWL